MTPITDILDVNFSHYQTSIAIPKKRELQNSFALGNRQQATGKNDKTVPSAY